MNADGFGAGVEDKAWNDMDQKDASHTNYERQYNFHGPNVKGAVFILYNHKITQ